MQDGWLSPMGEFYALADYDDCCHDCSARIICRTTQTPTGSGYADDDLLDRGWLKIYSHGSWYPRKPQSVTQKQMDWLFDNIVSEVPDAMLEGVRKMFKELEVHS